MTKITEYPNTRTSPLKTDLIDVSADIGGGEFESQKMEMEIVKRIEGESYAFSANPTFDLSYNRVVRMPVTGDSTINVSGLKNNGFYYIILQNNSSWNDITVGASLGSILKNKKGIASLEPDDIAILMIQVDSYGTVYYHRVNPDESVYMAIYDASYIDQNADTSRTFVPATEIGGGIDYAIFPVFAVNPLTGIIYQYFRVSDSHLSDSATDSTVMQQSADGGITWTALGGGADGTFTYVEPLGSSYLYECYAIMFTDTGRAIMCGRQFNGTASEGQRLVYTDDNFTTFTSYTPPWLNISVFSSVNTARGENGEYIILTLDNDGLNYYYALYESSLKENGERWHLRSYAQIVGASFPPYLAEPYLKDFGNGLFVAVLRMTSDWSYTSPTNMNVPAIIASHDYGRTWGGASSEIGNPVSLAEITAGIQGHANWLPLEGEGVTLGDNGFYNCLVLIEKYVKEGRDYMLIAYYNRLTFIWKLTAISVDEWILRGKYAIRTDIAVTFCTNTPATRYDGNGSIFIAKGNSGMLWTNTDSTSAVADVSYLKQGYLPKSSIDALIDSIPSGTRY